MTIEFHPPNGLWGDVARRSARAQFLDIIAEEQPQVLHALLAIWREFKPRYEESAKLFLADQPASDDTQDSDWLERTESRSFDEWFRPERAASDAAVADLTARLIEWSRQFFLDEDWVRVAAISTISMWDADPASETETRWGPLLGPGIFGLLSEDEETFSFETRWDPLVEDRKAAQSRIEREFKGALVGWFDQTEELARDHGLPELPNKRKLETHLRWLAHRQIADDDFVEIAEAAGLKEPEFVGRRAVSTAVHKAAELLGLTLRPSPPGRHTR